VTKSVTSLDTKVDVINSTMKTRVDTMNANCCDLIFNSYVMLLIALSVTKSVTVLENKVDAINSKLDAIVGARIDADAKIRSLDAKVEALNTSVISALTNKVDKSLDSTVTFLYY